MSALLCAVGAACTGSPTGAGEPAAAVVPTFVRVESDPGFFYGGGTSFTYTKANSVISVVMLAAGPDVRVTGDVRWEGFLEVPMEHGQIVPGTFTRPVSWSGIQTVCTVTAGWLTVDSAKYVNGFLNQLDLRFEQQCEAVNRSARGTIHWAAADTTRPPGPVNPIPVDLWRPPAGATPAAGNYLFIQSDSGAGLGSGPARALTLTPPASLFAVSSSDGRVEVSVDTWKGFFQGMSSLPQLVAGYYPNLQRYPFHNPARGGMDWSGEGSGCNQLAGWFVVDNVTYRAAAITALDLRFEQHCELRAAAIHGAVHWAR